MTEMEIKIFITEQDRKVGAMVKALAVEVSGYQSVKGATKEFLNKHGYYIFSFPTTEKVDEFEEAIRHYLPGCLAKTQR